MFDLGLKDKVTIVTGGSDGLGRATAETLASQGAKVVICGRRADHLQAAAEAIAAEHAASVEAVQADVSVAADCERLVAETIGRFGGVDILVNNAGASAAFALEEVSDEAWQSDFDLKVMAAVRLCRAVVPSMRARGGGSIVNAAIGGGKAPPPRQLPTSLTRAAGLNLTKSLSGELAADNIRVNAICIGLLQSAQWERRAEEGRLDAFYQELGEKVPLGRVGTSEDYGALVAFLCSSRATYITGTAVNLDGGLCATL